MAKAVVDPAELRRFAQDLKRFNTGLRDQIAVIQAKLQGVGLKIFRAANGNQKDSGVVARAQAMIDNKQAKDMEDALNKLYDQTSGEERNKVKRTQKAFGFRHSRHS